jgi:hypothetical protein
MINVNQITSKLAVMPDAALKQFAEMHKQDPYSFSLAISESNRRKQIRSQVPPAQEQPKVADQELSAMTKLPEEVGIGALPVDMNMASGGIVAFDDGGDVYSNEGRNSKTAYREYALAKAKENGVDPVLVDSIFNIESGYKADAQSPTGPQGIGQLTKATGKAYGVNPQDRKDPYKNIDASIAFMADLNKKYAGDPAKIAVAYNQGETVLNKHLRANKGELNASALPTEAQGYLKKLQKFAFKLAPGSTAQAEEVPLSQSIGGNESVQSKPTESQQGADRSIGGQFSTIGQGLAGIARKAGDVVAPEGAGGYNPGTRNFFERAADNLGISEEFQRNASNTLNALPGVSMARFPKAVGALSSGAQAAREAEVLAAAAKAEQAAQKVANVRLPAPTTPQGIERLAGSAVAPPAAPRTTFPIGEEALRLKQQQQAAAAARANQAAKEPNLGAKMELDKRALQSADENAAATFNTARASEAAEIENAAKLANATNRVTAPINTAANINATNTGLNALDAQMQRSAFAATDPRRTDADQQAALNTPAAKDSAEDMPREIQSLENRYPLKKEDLTKKDQKEIIADAKDAVPSSAKTKGFTNDDWLQFGLALMAGQSPYALQNVGTAGLSAVAGKKEREKEERAMLSKMMDKTDMTKVIDRLMRDDPSLSYRDAYEIFQQGKTNADLIARGLDIKGQSAGTDRASKIAQRKADLDKVYPPILRNSDSPTGKKMAADYAAAVAAIEKEFPAIPGAAAPATTIAPAALPLKVLNKQPSN